MKTLALFLVMLSFWSFTSVSYSQEAKVSLRVENKTVGDILSILEKETEFYFTYNPQEVNTSKKISIDLKDKNITLVLNSILDTNIVGYTVDGKHIALYKKADSTRMNNASAVAQQTKKITGNAVDYDTDNPLIGVTVKIKGREDSGTMTDIDGDFEINASSGDIIEFSYIGYLKQQLTIGNKNVLYVKMREDIKSLDEVVVIGYSTQKRANLSGAVATISGDVMKSKPVNNPLSALQGEVPGMVIQRGSGSPGNEEFSMNIRGISTIHKNTGPLIIVDGIAGEIGSLNPDDIESFSILKDAQAAIYGARASSGVVLVTTKSGKSGKPKINYSGNVAYTKRMGLMKGPTTYEMAIMDNEANIHNGSIPMYTEGMLEKIRSNDPNPIPHPLYGGWMLFFTNTDWMNELLENGFQHKHNVSVTGGGANSSYYLSAGYVDQQGVVKYADDNNKRYNLRLNYDYTFFDRVRLETKVSYEHQKRTSIGRVGEWIIGEATYDMPNTPIYNSSGNYFAQGGWSNAVALARESATSEFKTTNLNTNFKLIVDVVDGLKAVLQAGISQTWLNSKDPSTSIPLYSWANQITSYMTNPAEASLLMSSKDTQHYSYTGYLQYNKEFAQKHNLDVMIGLAHEKNNYDTFTAWRDGFRSDGLWDLELGGSTNMRNTGGGQHWSINSMFGRAGYAFDEKYLLETNFRYDGSSRFSGGENRWGFFPGVSAGWRITKEDFMKEVDFLSELKLRASYGTTGNQDGIGLYDFIQKLKIRDNWRGDPIIYPFGAGSRTQSIQLDGIVARNRKWETIINQNIGVDARALNNRLDISFDYYWKRNKDMLVPVKYPSLLGAIAPYSNSGELKSWGFEASVGWKDKIGAVGYFAKLVFSDSQNKVTKYGGDDTYKLGGNEIREGYPMNSYFTYVFDGLIRTQKELDEYKKLEGVPSYIGIGDAKFKDLNNDGKISTYADGNDGDAKYVGNTAPRLNYGITLGANYKGFDFSVFFQGVGKRTLFREGDYRMPWSDWWRQPAQFYYMQTWNEDRQDAHYPRLSHGEIRHWNYQESTLQKVDASYIRLKNLQVGYTIPSSITKHAYVSRARVYFSGQDLWEHHDVKGGWDPESADWGSNYPFQRYYSFGIDITF